VKNSLNSSELRCRRCCRSSGARCRPARHRPGSRRGACPAPGILLHVGECRAIVDIGHRHSRSRVAMLGESK
jgi:hypothetical protein